MKLRGKVALVTGASRGIGHAIAVALRAQGADLVLTATSEKSAHAGAAALPEGDSRVAWILSDLSRPGEAHRMARAAVATFGQVDLLVNNAGVLTVSRLQETSEEDFRRVMEVNVHAPFALIRELVPHMVARKFGRVVNISSISGTIGTPRMIPYNTSKHALNGMTRSLAEELRGTGVLVAAVLPGSTDTDMLQKTDFAPVMKPADVARVVSFICADAPMAMHGSLVEVYG